MTYEPNIEDGRTDNERTPMLSPSQQARSHEEDGKSSSFLQILQFFGGGIYAPDPSTYDPIEILLNTEDPKERDELTVKWKDNKLSELSFVGVVSALLAAILTSTGSWPNILPNSTPSPWPIRTSWYCGIVLSLFSILSAADQTVRLHRLASHRDGLHNIRRLLGKRNAHDICKLLAKRNGLVTPCGGRRKPSLLQIMTWQMPVMFLTTATLCMIVGLFLHVWSATTHLGKLGAWDEHTKVAVTYTIVAVIAIVLFFVGQISLYCPIRR